MSDDNTRPISVAELLARNGTIGSPPVGGHRRRKRRNAVSVADLTGEIPVVRTGEIPVVYEDEPADRNEAGENEAGENEYVPATESATESESESAETVVVYSSAPDVEATDYTDTPDYTPDYTYVPDPTPEYTYVPDTTLDYTYTTTTVEPDVSTVVEVVEEAHFGEEDLVEEAHSVEESGDLIEESGIVGEVVHDAEAVDVAVGAEGPSSAVIEDIEVSAPRALVPPRSSIPRPRRRRGPERSHDPRPRRRSSDAEQMTYDPVDEAVDLADLVAEQVPDAEELRSYMRSSTGALFSGETVADDLARRGLVSESDRDGGYNDEDYEQADAAAAPGRGALSAVGNSFVAIVQSLLAVVFGAGLFIAFDQLWRWNNIVALALSTLVIVALVVGVHVVRKTEDFVSILIAVAVGILVTFGPLALQST